MESDFQISVNHYNFNEELQIRQKYFYSAMYATISSEPKFVSECTQSGNFLQFLHFQRLWNLILAKSAFIQISLLTHPRPAHDFISFETFSKIGFRKITEILISERGFHEKKAINRFLLKYNYYVDTYIVLLYVFTFQDFLPARFNFDSSKTFSLFYGSTANRESTHKKNTFEEDAATQEIFVKEDPTPKSDACQETDDLLFSELRLGKISQCENLSKAYKITWNAVIKSSKWFYYQIIKSDITHCGNYGNLLTLFWQKFRENNGFTKEITK